MKNTKPQVGRPPIAPELRYTSISISLNEAQKEYFRNKGGSVFFRQVLNKMMMEEGAANVSE